MRDFAMCRTTRVGMCATSRWRTRAARAERRMFLLSCADSADALEDLGNVEVQDITFQQEIREDGPWWSATVYFHSSS